MSDVVIEIEGLRKEFRRRRGTQVAVDGLDLSVPRGGVHGFLGPNGSGKTTTIRCLLGLVRPSRGHMALLGRPLPGGLPAVIGRVGAIVETPAFFPTMSARENLRLLAGHDRIPVARIDDALGQVGLGDRAGDQVRRYSLGMRQRLGLAAALLKDPEILVLDEPANGLDPAGIREIRQLLRQLGSEGRTVWVSSHILTEVEQICDTVAILRRGRCIASGTVDDVMATGGPGSITVRFDGGDPAAARQVLADHGYSATATGRGLRVEAGADQAAAVNRVLGEAGHWVAELRAERQSLEDLFLELTADAPAADGADPEAAR